MMKSRMNTPWFCCLLNLLLLPLTQAAAADNKVQFAKDHLNVGTFLIGTDQELRGAFELKNTTDQDLSVTAMRVSCGCVKINTGFKELRKGESGTVHFTVTPETTNRPAAAHPISAHLTVAYRLNDGVVKELRGTIQYDI